jgi:hypothetical protein
MHGLGRIFEETMSHAGWLLHAPGVTTVIVLALGVGLAVLCWPRGCCKEDDLFSRHAI